MGTPEDPGGFAALVDQHTTHLGGRCRTGIVLDTMDADERDEVLAVLDDPMAQSAAICRALRARGYDVGDQSVRRHRQHACKCDRRPTP